MSTPDMELHLPDIDAAFLRQPTPVLTAEFAKRVHIALSAIPPSTNIRSLWITEQHRIPEGEEDLFGTNETFDNPALVAWRTFRNELPTKEKRALTQLLHTLSRTTFSFGENFLSVSYRTLEELKSVPIQDIQGQQNAYHSYELGMRGINFLIACGLLSAQGDE